ncbi:exopolyphosphatase [Tistrella bauzanensis]|uniref:Exopolyphosphatase n=1 Tax=Tistrella bauzanensis TaxID=657419 RepID=A0ABQ1IY62_9PROT|nr:Ppx/GppA family phosphatase [Tistrella bauzanensis]GGB52592.1 exopolyphosphatase [Tistrella bauzanensis]
MSDRAFPTTAGTDMAPDHRLPGNGPRRLGVVDIGSNSLRLVIFDGLKRMPQPIFNEKALCALGSGVAETGRLDPERVEAAITALKRFSAIGRELADNWLIAVATAAVRDAEDGPAFIQRVERDCGMSVRTITGVEEATLSALGVLSAEPEADGLVADLGGGSLELVRVEAGAVGRQITLPVGALRLAAKGIDNRSWTEAVERALDDAPWAAEAEGRGLYLVGGGWRALARVHIAEVRHPIAAIHRYTLDTAAALALADRVMAMKPAELARLKAAPSRRVATLPHAAAALAGLVRRVRPHEIVFSAYGLREGVLYENLPASLRAADPLMAACRDLVDQHAGFADYGDHVHEWIKPLFPDESPNDQRLRHAACLLSEIAIAAHPDRRAEHAVSEILSLPFLPLRHAERAFLALAIYARYAGNITGLDAKPARDLLDQPSQARARLIGLALRLADTFSGCASALLDRARIEPTSGTLTLHARPDGRDLMGEVVERRLESLAKAMRRRYRMKADG